MTSRACQPDRARSVRSHAGSPFVKRAILVESGFMIRRSFAVVKHGGGVIDGLSTSHDDEGVACAIVAIVQQRAVAQECTAKRTQP
jgi:hypothetical protein